MTRPELFISRLLGFFYLVVEFHLARKYFVTQIACRIVRESPLFSRFLFLDRSAIFTLLWIGF
jgi:hypothetical protein